jgi:phosphopantothenoylcysteine decarboxylase/phosphopantothenate--cysteine ligase
VKRKNTSSSRILITAGPTIEPLDPVRYISNYSTGTMGYEIAKESKRRGFDACLITGPVHLPPPRGIEVVRVSTACEMRDQVMRRIRDFDCLVMAAAVCDFRPRQKKEQKIKKQGKMTLELVKNPDILMDIGKRKGLIKVGFALETEKKWLKNAKNKLRAKKMDLMIVNVKERGKDPFGPGKKEFMIIDNSGNVKKLKKVSKPRCAGIILKEVERLF